MNLKLCLAGVLFSLTALASAHPAARGDLNARQRIDHGVHRGDLTPREAHRLEHRLYALHAEKRRMLSDGRLSRGERHELRREREALDRAILRERHDRQRNHRPRG